MHEGEVSARLGLTGWPAVAEEAIIARDILLAQHVGSRLHICHVSTAGSVELVRLAKSRGVAVTAEVTPHHLLLTEALADSYDPIYKVNPPLRRPEDVADCGPRWPTAPSISSPRTTPRIRWRIRTASGRRPRWA
jgi:dihydroorotase